MIYKWMPKFFHANQKILRLLDGGHRPMPLIFPPSKYLENLEEKYPELCVLSPGEMFLKLFSEDIQNLIVQETQRYAHEVKKSSAICIYL